MSRCPDCEMKDYHISIPRSRLDELLKSIADLEAKLAQSQTELAELRGVHRQLVNDAQGLGKKLIEDTCG